MDVFVSVAAKCTDMYSFQNGICEFPDVAERPDCSPEEILRFKCPTTVSERLLPKEDDCRFFFRCLPNGHPRLAGNIYERAAYLNEKFN